MHLESIIEGEAIVARFGVIQLGRAAVDLDRECVRDADGRPVPLRHQSFAVLRVLIENGGRIVTKDELVQAVWPKTAVTDDSLVQCIGDIRRALGTSGAVFLKTVPRRGYLLDASPVTPSEPADHREITDAGSRPYSTISGLWNMLSSNWTARRVLAGFAAMAIVLVLAMLNVVAQSAAPKRSGPPKLAVIPLTRIGDDAALDYFASGTTENLVTQLSRSPELRLVEAREAGTDASRSPVDIGRAAGADYVLFGSIQKSASTMRILAHLVDVGTGEHLWAERFDRTAKDPFQLQDDVTSATLMTIAGEDGLIRKRLYEEAWGRDTGALKEYDFFLRGHDMFMRFTERDNQEAMRIWSEGLERYPDSGILAVKAGYAIFMRLQLGWTKDREADLAAAFALGRQGLAAARQMPLSRTLGHMLLAELNFYDHKFEAAMKERAFVLQLAPYDFFHRANLAYVAVGSGHPEEAVAALNGITPNHPLADFGYAALAWAQFALKNYPAAIEASRAARQPVPVYAYAFEAASHAELGQTGSAKEALEKLLVADPTISLQMIRDLHPNADKEVLEREIAALRRTGLPEVASPTRSQ